MKGFAIVMMVVMADIVVNMTPIPNTVPETQPVVVETQTPTEEPTEAQRMEIPAPPAQEGFQAYSIYGQVPPVEWQRYLYDELASRGYAWYMPYAVCQIFLESRWNQWADNGRDRGLCQQKAIYWDSRAAHYGIPGADIWDPYAQLYVFSAMMSGYLAECGGDIGRALSAYYLGTWEYSQRYVDLVMAHWEHLEEIR